MPIRREERSKYPADWDAISRRIRIERAGNRCEHEDRGGFRCTAVHGQPNPITGATVVLSVAHLNHDPRDCRDENLKAMCQYHHLGYDRQHHRACPGTIDMFRGVA